MKGIVDSKGRLQLPEAVRKRLDLHPGSVVEIETTVEEDNDEAVFRIRREPSYVLTERDGILVHQGRSAEPLDPVDSVRSARAIRSSVDVKEKE
jgi:AbrB family looped-hinge helix DNA binding protein